MATHSLITEPVFSKQAPALCPYTHKLAGHLVMIILLDKGPLFIYNNTPFNGRIDASFTLLTGGYGQEDLLQGQLTHTDRENGRKDGMVAQLCTQEQ